VPEPEFKPEPGAAEECLTDVEQLPSVLPVLRSEADFYELDRDPQVIGPWVRGTLVGLALGLTAVMGIAVWLNPYEPDGTPRRLGTHPQLGLPPCEFLVRFGRPCPGCGMTTSFSLLMHGDPLNSLRANCVGTGTALFCLSLIPWCLASAWYGRTLFIRSLEAALITTVLVFLGGMLLRWFVVLSLFSSS
jgi:hypothetical protein